MAQERLRLASVGMTFVFLLVCGHESEAPPPILFDIAPRSGPTAGGTVLSISGAHLAGTGHVCRFGHGVLTTPGKLLRARSSHGLITCATPEADAGYEVAVEVSIDSAKTFTHAGFRFTYYHEAVISSASPSSGPAAGGTVILVTGYNFAPTPASQCVFGWRRAAATVMDFQRLRCVVPAQTANGSLSLSFKGTVPQLHTAPAHVRAHAQLGGAARLADGVMWLAGGQSPAAAAQVAGAAEDARAAVAGGPSRPVSRLATQSIAAAAAIPSHSIADGCGALTVLILRDSQRAPLGFSTTFRMVMGGELSRGVALSYGELTPRRVAKPSAAAASAASSTAADGRASEAAGDGVGHGGGSGGSAMAGGARGPGGLWDELGVARGLSVRLIGNSPNHYRPLSVEVALDLRVSTAPSLSHALIYL